MRAPIARNGFLTRRHLKAHDKHVVERTFTCGTCGKNFTTPHMLTSTPLISNTQLP